MKILGIDPSLTSTGLALVEDGRVLGLLRVRTKTTGHERVQQILDTVESLLAEVTVVGIEGPAFAAKGSSVVQIFGLWGVITHMLWTKGCHYYVVPPACRSKYATGKGTSSKDEVLAAVVRRYFRTDVTGNDVADALLVAAMGARHHGVPLLEEGGLSRAHLDAMKKVAWT